jgi:exodeoxyribonuclease X
MKPLFLDVETTGTEQTDRLCQIAYKIENLQQVDLFKPPVPVSVEAMAITHITNKMLEKFDPFENSLFKEILQAQFDDENTVFVAHNAEFDMGFLLKEGMVLPKNHICTMKVAHHFDEKAELKRHTLQFLRYYYDLQLTGEINAHDALSDVLVLEKLYEFYSQHFTVEQMIEISSKPILLKKMNFGKYKDQWFKDIAKKDMDYILWMRRSMDLDPNMRYTLDHYIKSR